MSTKPSYSTLQCEGSLRNLASKLPEFKCPLCHSSLESAEYYLAVEELKKKVSETYSEQHKKVKQEFELKLEEMNKAHKDQISELQDAFEGERKTFQKEIEETHKQQLADLKKNYASLSKENQKNFAVLVKKIKDEGKKELEEKEKQLAELKREQPRLKKLAFEEARAEADIEMS